MLATLYMGVGIILLMVAAYNGVLYRRNVRLSKPNADTSIFSNLGAPLLLSLSLIWIGLITFGLGLLITLGII